MVALTKVRFCSSDYCFYSETKMESPKKRFTHLTDQRRNGRIHCRKRLQKTQHATRTAVSLYLQSHSCNKLFCFNNCGLFCLCYLAKHFTTVSSGNICLLSLKSQCFPRLRLRKHQNSRETNRCFPRLSH